MAMTDKALAAKIAALATENGYDFAAEELFEFSAARPLCDADVEKAAGSGPGITGRGPGRGSIKKRGEA